MSSVPGIEYLYGPSLEEISIPQISLIRKFMPFSTYLRYIETNAAQYEKIKTYTAQQIIETGITQEMVDSLNNEYHHMFVSGAHILDGEEVVEDMTLHPTVLNILKQYLLPKLTRKVYVTFVTEHRKSRFVHPKIVEKCMNDKIRYEGGLIMPGFDRPVATTILTPGENGRMISCVSGGRFSNFHSVKTAGMTLRSLGCNPDVVPDIAGDTPIDAVEKFVHLFKSFATVQYPDVMGVTGKESENRETFEKLKAETVPKHQKSLGGAKYTFLNAEKYSEFSKEGNAKIMAGNIVTRIALGDHELWDYVLNNASIEHTVMEAAHHGAELGFSGPYFDYAWTSVGGMPGVFLEPDTVVDGVPRTCFFERGITLVVQATAGDKEALKALGLTERLSSENMQKSAALIWETCFRDLARVAAACACACA